MADNEEPLYKTTDNVYQRLARFAPRMNIMFDERFKGQTKAGKEMSWEYLSIHAIRAKINNEACKYGLYIHTRAQVPVPDMLPEDTVVRGGQTLARAWQEALVTNIDDPTQVASSLPTSGEALCTDDKATSKAKQQAAKTALIALLNIAAGEDDDASVGFIDPAAGATAPTAPADAPAKPPEAAEILCKLQPAQIERFRELMTEQKIEEKPTIARISKGKANRLEQPLNTSTIRELMKLLNVADDKIAPFINRLLTSTEEVKIPEQQFDQRNAKLAFTRLLDTLSPQARATFLSSNEIEEKHVGAMNDAQAARFIPRLQRYLEAVKNRDRMPASRQLVQAGSSR